MAPITLVAPCAQVPIAFTSDHIETLFELDIEYGTRLREHVRVCVCVEACVYSAGGTGRL